MTKFSSAINVTKLKHVLIDLTTKDGRKIPGIFLPIEANYMLQNEKNKDSYLIPISVKVEDEANQFNQYGYIKQKVSGEAWEKATEEEREKFSKSMPFLGNLYYFADTKETDGAMNDPVQPPEPIGTDDLPF